MDKVKFGLVGTGIQVHGQNSRIQLDLFDSHT